MTTPVDPIQYLKNEWLSDLLSSHRDMITVYWIQDIRTEDIPAYRTISDQELTSDLPRTVDSMIYAFKTGNTEGPRQHSVGVISRRLEQGFTLPDLQRSLHALEAAVMRIVEELETDPFKKYQALRSTEFMYYQVALVAATVYERLRAEQDSRFTATYEFGMTLSRTLDLDTVLDTAIAQIPSYIQADAVAIILDDPKLGKEQVRTDQE